MRGQRRKRTLEKHPFGRPFPRTTPSPLLWRALKREGPQGGVQGPPSDACCDCNPRRRATGVSRGVSGALRAPGSGVSKKCPKSVPGVSKRCPGHFGDTLGTLFPCPAFVFFFLKKGKENHQKSKDFYSHRTPKIPGQEGKNAQKKKKEFLAGEEKKQGIPKKQVRARRARETPVAGGGALQCCDSIAKLLRACFRAVLKAHAKWQWVQETVSCSFLCEPSDELQESPGPCGPEIQEKSEKKKVGAT